MVAELLTTEGAPMYTKCPALTWLDIGATWSPKFAEYPPRCRRKQRHFPLLCVAISRIGQWQRKKRQRMALIDIGEHSNGLNSDRNTFLAPYHFQRLMKCYPRGITMAEKEKEEIMNTTFWCNPSQTMRSPAEMSDTQNRTPTITSRFSFFSFQKQDNFNYKVTLNLVFLLQTLAKCLLPLRP